MKKLLILLLAIAFFGCRCLAAKNDGPQPGHGSTAAPYSAQAAALYDAMIRVMREAKTLSYRSEYRWESGGRELGRTTYRIWMSKPNYARIETSDDGGQAEGILLLDGGTLWTLWPGGKPRFYPDDTTSATMYMKESAPPGRHSLGHSFAYLGAGTTTMTILDPSIFHGYTDSLQKYVDGVIPMGTEEIDGQTRDGIEVSIMDHQRSWYLWLSREDHLPRKLREMIRVDTNIIVEETWSEVRVNDTVPSSLYAWKPPAGWTEFTLPTMEEGLLKRGAPAPDFSLVSTDGKTISLSSYKGKIVWLNFWRVGCPPCREEFPHLQKVGESYGEKGVVILGFNCSDDRAIALDFIKETGATFPSILDTSKTAQNVCFSKYQRAGMGGVPLNYIIDVEGKVAGAWYGYGGEGDLTGEKILDSLISSP